MKKNIIDYYALIMLILFIIYNFILTNLKIGGLIYQIFMIVLIILNVIILIKFRKRIKFKKLIIVAYFFIWMLLSKNHLQCIFGISNMITLIVIGFKESKFIKIISILISLFFIIFSKEIFFIYLLTFGTNITEERYPNHIYEDMHYYCENNYEVYTYSAGAMDKFHYSIGKHYDFLDFNNIFYIYYSELNEVSKEEYEDYLKTYKCRPVSDINDSR